MFCSNCGKEIDDKAVICIHCGCQVNNPTKATAKNEQNGCLSGCLVIILVLGVIGVFFLLIAGTVGLNSVNEAINKETGQNSSALYKMIINE